MSPLGGIFVSQHAYKHQIFDKKRRLEVAEDHKRSLWELAKETAMGETVVHVKPTSRGKTLTLTAKEKAALRYIIQRRKDSIKAIQEEFSRTLDFIRTTSYKGDAIGFYARTGFDDTSENIAEADLLIKALLRLPYDFPVSTLDLDLILRKLESGEEIRIDE